MRRLVAIVALVLSGVVVGSAAGLEVDAGVLQTFHVEAEIDVGPKLCEAEAWDVEVSAVDLQHDPGRELPRNGQTCGRENDPEDN